MKKFLLKLSIFAAYVVLASVIFPIWLDPFNVFHAERIRPNRIEPNKNYIKMKYILANPKKFDTFIFGSSRVGRICTDKIADEKCYNMTYSVGLPGWHLLNLKTFLKNGIQPRKVYIGIDSVSYTSNYDRQVNEPLRCPYEYLADDAWHLMRLYLVPSMIFGSVIAMLDSRSSKIDVDIFYKYGYTAFTTSSERKYDWSKAIPSVGKKVEIDKALNFIREIADICRQNGIELVLFTNPMHRITYLASVNDKDYFKFLEGVAEISDFWNFSSINDITVNNDNYIETSHYKYEVGDLIIDVICNGKSFPELQRQGFGVKVTRENAKDFIAMLRKQAEEFKE
ncbi:MAG: hypothetical protein IJU07_08285 [Synergistaceae bacterium]|nr:hypothetical protein [Synergistaceae bacterium]